MFNNYYDLEENNSYKLEEFREKASRERLASEALSITEKEEEVKKRHNWHILLYQHITVLRFKM